MRGGFSEGFGAKGATRLVLAFTLLVSPPAFAGFMDNDPDAYVVNFYTGGGTGKVLFAAGTANQQCTNQGEPVITILSASPGLTLSIRPGTFVVTGTDYGYLVCQGMRLPGIVVTGVGRGEAVLRVTYPPIGQWYTHTVRLPQP